jgi:hypothetical protein
MRDEVSFEPFELRLGGSGTYVPERTATAAQVTRRGDTFIVSNLVRNKKRPSRLALLPPTPTSSLHHTVHYSWGCMLSISATLRPGQSSQRRLHLLTTPPASSHYHHSEQRWLAVRMTLGKLES